MRGATLRSFKSSSKIFLLCGLAPNVAHAFPVTDDLEMITIPDVGQAYKAVSYDNTYTSPPIIVCSGHSAGYPTHAATVRLNNVTASGFDVRTQGLSNDTYVTGSSPVTVGDVHCIVAKEGEHKWPNDPTNQKIWFEAGKKNVTRTFGNTTRAGVGPADDWNQALFEDGQVFASTNLSGAFTGSPLSETLSVVAQIMTDNDPAGQVPFVSDCDARQNHPYADGFSDGLCVGRHVGRLAWTFGGTNDLSRAPEDIGYIVYRHGSDTIFTDKGAFNAIGWRSGDSILGTRQNPPYTSGLAGYLLDGAVVTQLAEDGGDGGFAALHGTSPFLNNQIDLVIEEAVTADRNHTHELVGYFGFQKLTVNVAVEKKVDIIETDQRDLLSYTVEVNNLSNISFDNTEIEDVLRKDTVFSDIVSTLTLTESQSANGILDIGEIWSYTTTYQITEQDLIDYDEIENGFVIFADPIFDASGSVIRFGLTPTEAYALTKIKKTPQVSVVKTSKLYDGSAIPASGVKVGDVIVYTYEVTNTGNQILAPLEITDDHRGKGDPLDFGTCTIKTDVDNNHTILGTTDFTIASLGPKDVVACTASYSVTQADIDLLQ